MSTARPAEPVRLADVLKGPGYLKTLLLSGLVGIPVSLVAFWFLAGIHELQHALWSDLPHALGRSSAPWWRRVSRRPRPSCCGCRSAARCW
ncbi:hypothetical protein [Streptomyces lavendulae]|uniref:hypothetical protein n=1 Tax=Streptomyces lavendulae TaxID=1914 RepID=UPI001BAE9950|nr:hypothetical protein [Streptomyces lavendulae]